MNPHIKKISAFNTEVDNLTARGDVDTALIKCNQFLEHLKILESSLSDSFDDYRVLGIGYFDLASSYRNLSAKEPAEQAYLKAMEFLQGITKSDEHKEFGITQVAACKNHLGLLYMDHGPVNLAIKYLDAAIWDRKYILDQYPENNPNKMYLAGAYCNRAHIEREAGRPKSSMIYYKDSISLLEDTIPPCDCGCRDARASAISNAMGHPHWIITAHSFLYNATAGLELAENPPTNP